MKAIDVQTFQMNFALSFSSELLLQNKFYEVVLIDLHGYKVIETKPFSHDLCSGNNFVQYEELLFHLA